MELETVVVEGTKEELQALIDIAKELIPYAERALERGEFREGLSIISGIGCSFDRYSDAIYDKTYTTYDNMTWLNNRLAMAIENENKEES